MAIIPRYLIAGVLLMIFFSSCQVTKKVHKDRLYLQGIDTTDIAAIKIPDPIIQKSELMSIIVYSDNSEASALFNQVQNGATGGGGVSSTGSGTDVGGASGVSGGGGNRGYLVDINGNIYFHSLGLVHVEGLTKEQLKAVIMQKLDTSLKHPYVEIRFLNKRVTLLGELTRPGVIDMPEERISILDAIALSGDITNFGRKDNILVIREENGKRTTGRLNINDASVYRSEFFYLHRDDMVYVEPDRKKPTGTDQTLIRNITLAATLISTFAIVYSIFRR